jgi:uncharacterized protein YoxC
MTSPQETLDRIDEAIARFELALQAVRQIPQGAGHTVTIEGIAHELEALAPRLRELRDDVAGKADHAE